MSGARTRISFRAAGYFIVRPTLAVLLVGCTAVLEDRVARQDAAVSDLETAFGSLRSDIRGLRDEMAALQVALATETREATDREAGESRDREARQALGTRLAAAERRLEELGDGILGLEGSIASLAEQIARLEAGGGSAASLPRSARSVPRRSAAAVSPEELFDRAMENVRAGELGQAVLDFEEFADKYPAHPLAPSAQFWIGEAYFRSRDFEQAAVKYQKAVDLAPTGDRTPDALLRLGLALRSLHREDRAREVWARLLRDFPDSEAAVRARVVLRQPSRTIGPTEPR